MAMKGDMSYVGNQTDIGYFMNQTGQRGIIVIHDTSLTGSGAALDDAGSAVKIPGVGGASGSRPAGALVNDVVNYDLTRQHINWHKDEVQLGGKVTLLRGGPGAFIVTNMISGSPTAGQKAYYNDNGEFTATTTGSDQVGRFGSAKDVDGYAKVYVNIV